MVDDLPELNDLFEDEHKKHKSGNGNENKILIQEASENEISIYISRGDDKWILSNFIDVAPSNIGIHLLIPIDIDIKLGDTGDFKIKFEETIKGAKVFLKELPVLVRWQEKDQLSGRVKLGLHFHGDTKKDPDVQNILDRLKKKS
jgi:hypothetical protein